MKRTHPIVLLSLVLLPLILAMTTGIAIFWSAGVLVPSPTIAPSRQERLSPPLRTAPSLTYDTRPCRAHPSQQPCDGKLPRAAWDAQVSAGQDGNEACLDGE